MSTQLQISAKDLGRLALPHFCPKCFWTLRHMQGEPPFMIFPSIFSHIDGFTKRVVHGYFDQHQKLPSWLDGVARDVTGYINPPGHKVLRVEYPNGVVLCGTPDAVFRRADGTLIVGDYKTAFCKGSDDPLFPIYFVQLNVYAMLLEAKGYGKVSALKLIYTEPQTGEEAAVQQHNLRIDGFAMSFSTKIVDLAVDPTSILSLIKTAKSIYDLPSAPKSFEGCKDCLRLLNLTSAGQGIENPFSQIGVPRAR